MQRKSLSRDQCALFKVQSPRRLAEILCMDLDSLRELAGRGAEDYRVYEDKDIDRWIESPSDELKKGSG